MDADFQALEGGLTLTVLAHLASCPHWEHSSLGTQHAAPKVYGKGPVDFARSVGRSLQSNSYFMPRLSQERRVGATTSFPSALKCCQEKKSNRSEEKQGKPRFSNFSQKISKEQVDGVSQFERVLFNQCGTLLAEKLPILLLTLLNWILHIQVHFSISGWTDCFLNAQNGSSKMMYYSNLFPVKWKKNGSFCDASLIILNA